MTGADVLYSRYAQRVDRRYAQELAAGLLTGHTAAHLQQTHAALMARGYDSAAALRVLRQLVLRSLIDQDCLAQAPLGTVTMAMTTLAEFALDLACTDVLAQLDAVHGAPLSDAGKRAQLWVVGMGKLGARELNVSSDIDLVFVYDEDGQTQGQEHGRGQISNQEYFTRAVRAISAYLAEPTEHGFVFRVDLALRPNGNSGPPAVSLAALEEYFQVQGREWERFAWLKSRVVAPRDCISSGSAAALRTAVLPFVFRRYLDYSVFESLRALHQQIRDHALRRSAGRPERSNDVKLSRGGIREIEFTVQLLQVVRGGQFPELRTRPTLTALPRLAQAQLMTAATAQALAQAYEFLRRVEHRIQYLDDQQTHVLPTQDADLHWIARTLGLSDAAALLTELDAHRERVALEFDKLLGGTEPKPCKGCTGAAQATDAPQEPWSGLPQALQERIHHWQQQPRLLALRESARTRAQRLLERTVQWLSEGHTHEAAVLRFMDWLEPLLRRESYLALLLERPGVHERLLRLLGAARWPARYLLKHPGVIDELAGPSLLAERFEPVSFERDLEQRRQSLAITGEDDDEALLNLLRRAYHAEVFRTLARDVEGVLTVEQVADDLSALADTVLAMTARWCWQRLKTKHRADPQFAILGYGKLGGKELGYGSDLDIVFVYEDSDERASEVYGTLVRKLVNWLTVKTSEGDLFDIDTALRPNGNSGLLIITFDAYANYQQQRGSNTAWTWEHQAMTRARFVLGHAELGTRFDAVRQAVICAPRDAAALRQEIITMREKVAAAHPVSPGQFDLKHSAGGMVDAEFAVQYLVLTHAAAHPELRPNVGNIALLQRAEQVGLLPAGVGQAAAQAYRRLRQEQHRARLDERATQVATTELAQEQQAICALWQAVFEPGSPAAQ